MKFQTVALILSFSLLACSTFAASTALDCRLGKKVEYKAELTGTGNVRAITVTFHKRPTTTLAAKIVESCMRIAVNQDPAHELLGSAWVGETQIPLAPGKDNLVYFPREKKIRPFGFDEVLKGLKHK
jgi:hypothetical protein